ncbi:MAG: AraC family transcriptional regulator, partial [Clostridia bacterium]|nr:AraC family transcriptional regulator [Clostridia bacterium]
ILRSAKSTEENLSGPAASEGPVLSEVNLKICEYIQSHYSQRVTLDEIAEELAYSKNYLCQTFKKQMSVTINRYLYEVRLQKAQELLIHSDYKISYVSERAGFITVNLFNRLFKNRFGITPGRYREMKRSELWEPIFSAENGISEDDLHLGNLRTC